MSFESIDPSIQRDMAGRDSNAEHLLAATYQADSNDEEEVSSHNPDFLQGTPSHFRDTITDTHADLQEFFKDIYPDIEVPALDDEIFGSTDWHKLYDATKAMNILGLKPRILIAPANIEKDTWKNIYTELQSWEKSNLSNLADHQLTGDEYGPLCFLGSAEEDWDGFTADSGSPDWTASVMSTITGVTTTGVDYYGFISGDPTKWPPNELVNKLIRLGQSVASLPSQENAMRRPSIERYLMMQALQVRYLRPALDSDLSASGIGSTSILDGVIYGSYDKNPTGTYFQGIKQVCIGNMNTDSHRKSTGIRHEVRGWE